MGFFPRLSISMWAGILSGIGILATIGLGLNSQVVQQWLQSGLERVATSGSLGPFLYAGLYLVGSILLLPCFPLTLGAGFLFGFSRGFMIASLSSTIGAAGAFLVGRYLARTWLTNRLAADERFQAIDGAVTREGWKIVVLARLATMFPYNLVNYAFGLSGIGLLPFVFATWVGRIPITALHTYVGSVSVPYLTSGEVSPAISRLEWGVYGLGWLATFAVTIYITQLAREALVTKMAQK